MTSLLRLIAMLALAAVFAVGLVACGGDDDEDASAGTTTATETETAAEDPPAEEEPPAAVEPSVMGPAADLRVTLDRLLGEHATLAAFAMQKGHDGAEDFDAIAASLENNTVDLGDAIGSVYGEEARDGFLDLWRQHIGFFVDYTVATAGEDAAAQADAIEQLDGYRAAFGEFIAGANPNLEAQGVADLLQEHVNQLTEALDTYAAGDYQTAYQRVREAYAHMYTTGDALSGAIVAQFPERFTS